MRSAASAPASRTSRRCSSVEKKPFARSGSVRHGARGAEVVERAREALVDEHRDRRSLRPRSYAGTMSSTRASGRMSPIDGERRLNSAIAESSGCDESVRRNLIPGELHEFVETRRSRAGVERLARVLEAFPDVVRLADRGDSARGVEEHGGAVATVRAREHVAQRRGVRRRVPAAQLVRRAALDPKVERVELVLADPARVNLAHEVRAARRELVDPARAVHDVRARRVELDERRGERPRELAASRRRGRAPARRRGS